MPTFDHYLTYQHNVQRYFDEHLERYDGVVLPLSITVSFPTGTRGFVRALLTKDATKRYFIDPRSALFQKRWNRAHVRPPHEKAAETFGPRFAAIAVKREVKLEDFQKAGFTEEVVMSSLDYQLSYPHAEDEKKKLKKYEAMLGGKKLKELGDPLLLIPPYFQFDAFGDGWFKVNQSCIEFARVRAREAGINLRPVIHFRGWPDVGGWDNVLDWLKGKDVKSVWLYPNNFKELEASISELKAYRTTVQNCVAKGVVPFALFGGYFAILLRKYGLGGFGNGIGYGEWRDSGYHKGGSPLTRIYIPRLHRFLDAPKAQALLDADKDGYFSEDCELLSEAVATGEPLEEIELARALHHFMDCRWMELQATADTDIPELLGEFDDTREVLKSIGELEYETYGKPLLHWKKSLA